MNDLQKPLGPTWTKSGVPVDVRFTGGGYSDIRLPDGRLVTVPNESLGERRTDV